MTLALELGGIRDPAIQRALQEIAKQFPVVATGGGGGGAPSGPAGGVLGGTYPNPGFAVDMATQAELDAHTVLTTTAHGGIVASTDTRLSDARTPTAHATTHQPGGTDAMAVDAAAATGSLRTLGTTATSAAAGNDSRLSDARTPTAHQASHQSGGSDALSGNLNAVGRSNISKAGVLVGARRGLNLIEGTNVTITAADDAAGEKVDVTIAAAAGASASALAGAYTPIVWGGGTVPAATAAATYPLWTGPHEAAATNVSALGTAGTLGAAFWLDPANWTVTGLTTKLRLEAFCHVGATAPGQTMTVGLYPVSAFLNTAISTAGTVTAGSTVAFTTPAANSHQHNVSTDINVPAANWFFIGVNFTGATAASSSTLLGVNLQRRWV